MLLDHVVAKIVAHDRFMLTSEHLQFRGIGDDSICQLAHRPTVSAVVR